MTRAQALTAAGFVAAVVLGAVGVSQLGSLSAGADGGLMASAFTLPDGGPWPMAPDSGNMPLGSCGAVPGLQTCVVATPSGYQQYQVFVPADGGRWLYNSTLAFDYRCADNTGTCLFLDGGLVPTTGSYPASQVTGAGCLARPSIELSGFSGAPAGCQP
jgi:hypothetical protein